MFVFYAALQNPVAPPVTVWLQKPEVLYPLAFSFLLLLIIAIVRLPDFLSWRRARHKEVLSPMALEQIMLGTPPVIVDLRPPAEFNGPKGHLRGSHNIPYGLLTRRIGEVAKDKRGLVVLVDSSDIVSHRAAPALHEAGYVWVRVLQGGMRAWRGQRLPVSTSGHKP